MGFWNELRLAGRTWRRTPALAAVIMLTLTVSIGATTTAFTLAYSVLVQPLPFPDVDRLVWITSYDTRDSTGAEPVINSNRIPQFTDWQQHLTTFDAVGAWAGRAAPDNFTLTGSGSPERLKGLRVTHQLLSMLGAQPAAGSLFRAGDDALKAPQTVVLSYDYWRRKFGGNPDIVGRSLTIGNIAGAGDPPGDLADRGRPGNRRAGGAAGIHRPLARPASGPQLAARRVRGDGAAARRARRLRRRWAIALRSAARKSPSASRWARPDGG